MRQALGRAREQIFPSPKIRDIFLSECTSKIDSVADILQHRRLTMKRAATLTQLPVHIVDAAKTGISAIVVWAQQREMERERVRRYLEAQSQRIALSDGAFVIRRVFVLPQGHDVWEDRELCLRLHQEISAGIRVGLIDEGMWLPQRLAEKITDFGLMDDQLLWTVEPSDTKEGLRVVTLSLDAAEIHRHVMSFDAIWEEVREPSDDLKRRIGKVVEEAGST